MTGDMVVLIGCFVGLGCAIALAVGRYHNHAWVAPERLVLLDLVLVAAMLEQTGDTLTRVVPQLAWEVPVLMAQGAAIAGLIALWLTRHED